MAVRPRHLAAYPYLALRALVSAPVGLRIVLLHDVPDHHLPALDRLVGWLARKGWLVDPGQAARMIKTGTGLDRPSVLLTFDDGFADNHAAALSVLDRHGAKAVFFVCPGLIEAPDQPQAIARHIHDGARAPQPGLGLMGWDQLHDLQTQGHVIGNHTMDHARLAGLSRSRLDDQIGQAALRLSEKLGCVADWFAFPFGDIASVDAAVLECVARHHGLCRSGVRGVNDARVQAMAVWADQVDLASPLAYQQATLLGLLDGRYAAQRQRLRHMAGYPA